MSVGLSSDPSQIAPLDNAALERQLLDYLSEAGVRGAYIAQSLAGGPLVHAPAEYTSLVVDACHACNVAWGGGGAAGSQAYQQVRLSRYIHPRQRAQDMFDSLIAMQHSGALVPPKDEAGWPFSLNDAGQFVPSRGSSGLVVREACERSKELSVWLATQMESAMAVESSQREPQERMSA